MLEGYGKVDDGYWERLATPSPHPVGTRIRLISMPDDPDPIAPGTCGTIMEFSNGAMLDVSWDNGRTLGVAIGIDTYEVI